MEYNTRSKRAETGNTNKAKLNNPNQLPSSASDFYPIHRRTLNIYYDNVENIGEIIEPLANEAKFGSYLLVNNLTRDELLLVGHRSDIMDKLTNEDEKHLHFISTKSFKTTR